jgi:diadenosine tetraphosphate (Ap4A) HIT family hydrolase
MQNYSYIPNYPQEPINPNNLPISIKNPNGEFTNISFVNPNYYTYQQTTLQNNNEQNTQNYQVYNNMDNPQVYNNIDKSHGYKETIITLPVPWSVPQNIQSQNSLGYSNPEKSQLIENNQNLTEKVDPLPTWINPLESIELKLIRKSKKKDTRCYTCKPRGKVKKHLINVSDSGLFVFHHDMHKRPVIIMTPVRHVTSIDALTLEELDNMFKSLKNFTNFWKIENYQVSYNSGTWQNHEHFHCKIRIPENKILRMRRDHFELLKKESSYVNI